MLAVEIEGGDVLRTFLLSGRVANDGIVDRDTLQVVVVRIIGIDERVRNVWHIEPSVAFARKVNLPAMDLECIHETLVKARKLVTQLHLVRDIRHTLRVADTHGLLHPKHIGEIGPCVRILHRRLRAIFPCEGTVFGQETAKGAAARTTVEPKCRSLSEWNVWLEVRQAYQSVTSSEASGLEEGKNLHASQTWELQLYGVQAEVPEK